MVTHFNELLNIFPKGITSLILQYSGPQKKWAIYWKNHAMKMISTTTLRSLPQTLYFMNEVYLRNLINDNLNVHIQLLRELNIIQYVYHNNYDTLIRVIKNNIKYRLSKTTLPNGMKLSIHWIPS